MGVWMTVAFYQIGFPGSNCIKMAYIAGILGVLMLCSCTALSVVIFVRV